MPLERTCPILLLSPRGGGRTCLSSLEPKAGLYSLGTNADGHLNGKPASAPWTRRSLVAGLTQVSLHKAMQERPVYPVWVVVPTPPFHDESRSVSVSRVSFALHARGFKIVPLSTPGGEAVSQVIHVELARQYSALGCQNRVVGCLFPSCGFASWLCDLCT